MAKCTCISEATNKVKDDGLTIVIEDGFQFRKTGSVHFYALSTKKRNGHRGAPLIIAFCPFCGSSIFEDDPDA